MKQIILVRHTEKEEIPGFTHVEADPHLTEKGRKQAKEIKDFLEKNNFDYEVVLTSLYNRAIETSEIVNDSKDKKVIKSISFNEYFLRPDGGNVEGSRMGTARTMAKIYSLYDQYKTVLIVCHRSIGRSILQPLLNMKFKELENYFVNYGDAYVLRYDNDLGDTNWRIIDSFTPEQ
jgi:broad specificity phosphatase PhoE